MMKVGQHSQLNLKNKGLNMLKILLVDDDKLIRKAMFELLEGLFAHNVIDCRNAEDALELIKTNKFDLILSDIKMPGMNGIELLRESKKIIKDNNTKFILFTGFGELQTAIEAIRLGADNYLIKPIDISLLNQILDEINFNKSINFENIEPEKDLENIITHKINNYLKNGSFLDLPEIGRIGIFSKELRKILEESIKYNSNPDISVLIEGESGTGKEVIARLIHHGLTFSEKPFIAINCSAITPSLFESELFGYEGGSFTGAKEQGMTGKLELANQGTIFFDEIADLPLEMQPKLLRVLQERKFYHIGGKKVIHLNVRFIAATNRNLKKMLEEGTFRRDLYHRINAGWIQIPPLRMQRESIVPLAQMFLSEISDKRNKNFKFLSKDAVKILQEYEWKGNVRELKNLIERIVLLFDEMELRPNHLKILEIDKLNISFDNLKKIDPFDFELPDIPFDLRDFESVIVRKTIDKFAGNKSKAAQFLKLTQTSLRSRMK